MFTAFQKGCHLLIIPDIDNLHFNGIDVMIDNIITEVFYYDSMIQPVTRSRKKKTPQPQIKDIHCKPCCSVQ